MSATDSRHGFSTPADFLTAVISDANARTRDHVRDNRLRALAAVDAEGDPVYSGMAFLLPAAFTPSNLLATAGSDEQGVYSDTYGGFAVGKSKAAYALGSPSEGDPTAGRTLVVPMDEPFFEIPARTDKDHTSSVSGGLTFTRKPDAVDATASRMAMEMVTLKAMTLMGFTYATEQLLGKSPRGFAAILAAAYRDEFPAHMLDEKINGLGGDQYLGVMHSPAKITVDAETGQAADTINATNVFKMAARCWGLNRAVWMANHDTREQLYGLKLVVGTAGTSIYQPSSVEGMPDMLLGAPVFYTERCATLGDEGDLLLVNWSQYLEGVYQPLLTAESVHVRFEQHERAFKFWTRNAGAPWWRSALTPANSTTTLSPIVSLAARA